MLAGSGQSLRGRNPEKGGMDQGVRWAAGDAQRDRDLAAGALIALAGCGSSSKPAYCSDRTNLENSIKNLPSATSILVFTA